MRRFLAAVAGTLVMAGVLVAPSPAAAVPGDDGTVFINELHYDNAGTDTGEFVEVAAPTGTDLTGWQVVLYNGANGASYDTDTLSGTVPADPSGYGFLVQAYPSNGIQNGAPDGVALVAPGGTVAQFLSYEGTMTATDGPAAGLTSTDIGVAQTGSEPVGSSLQLTGTGATYGDFDWVSTTQDTRGEANTGQIFLAPNNAPVVPDCGGTLTAESGEGGARAVSAADADGAVVSAALTSEPASEGISLTDVVPSAEEGEPLTATLSVDGGAALGSYAVSIAFANDDEEPQVGTCRLTVTVVPDPDAVFPISAVQGAGDVSPFAGQVLSVEAVVTSVLLGDDDGDQLGGFVVEEEAADRDDDPATSEGIFVYAGARSDSLDLVTGDLVRITGRVGERFGQTQLDGSAATATIDVLAEGVALPAPATLSALPAPTVEGRAAAFEPLESMRVRLAGDWAVTEHFDLHTFGELEIVPGSRPLQVPTNVGEPGPAAGAFEAATARKLTTLTLDDARDGNLSSTGRPAPYLEGGTGTIRRGTTLTDQVAVMSYGFDRYRLRPVDDESTITFAYADRPLTPPPVGGDLVVASFNVLNYFNGDGDGTGFPTTRGARTVEEFERQSAKIVAAITALDADVVGLVEIENDGYDDDSAVRDLTRRLNAVAAPGEDYAVVDAGAVAQGPDGQVGPDEITNAVIYRPATLRSDGVAVLDDVDPFTRNTRPAIAARFTELATGEQVVAIVNHFKSKGSGMGANADQGDGQGASNLDRVIAAEELLAWTETDPFFTGEDRLLVIGDINAYAYEDPIDEFREAGYTDLLGRFDTDGREAYTYVFRGLEGRLDHALANEELLPYVTGAAPWAINADEPRAKDYTFFNQPELYEPDAFRSSDHDPVLVGLDLRPDVAVPDVQRADVAVDVTAAADSVPSGGRVTFTVTVSAADVLTSDGVVIDAVVAHRLTLPRGASVSEVDAPLGTSFDADSLAWTIPRLGEGRPLELTVEVATVDRRPGVALLRATAGAPNLRDSDRSNNSARARVLVSRR